MLIETIETQVCVSKVEGACFLGETYRVVPPSVPREVGITNVVMS